MPPVRAPLSNALFGNDACSFATAYDPKQTLRAAIKSASLAVSVDAALCPHSPRTFST
jgi:hypothetical protein